MLSSLPLRSNGPRRAAAKLLVLVHVWMEGTASRPAEAPPDAAGPPCGGDITPAAERHLLVLRGREGVHMLLQWRRAESVRLHRRRGRELLLVLLRRRGKDRRLLLLGEASILLLRRRGSGKRRCRYAGHGLRGSARAGGKLRRGVGRPTPLRCERAGDKAAGHLLRRKAVVRVRVA